MKKYHLALLLLLVLLTVLWLVTTNLERERENTLNAGFPQVDLADINMFKIYSRKEQGQEVVIYRQGENWRVMKGTTDAPVHEGRMDVLLNELSHLQPTRLAGNSSGDQIKFGITDSSATRMIVIGDGGVLLDLMIGDFQYRDAQNQPVNRPPPGSINQRGITYIRLTGEDMIYSAEGFFGPNFDQVFETWRNQHFISLDPGSLREIHFRYAGGNNFSLQAEDGRWFYGDEPVHPKSQEFYSSLISYKKFTYFADAFQRDREPLFRVEYVLKDDSEVILEAFEANSGQIIIRSSQNPETFFLDYNDDLLNSYFPPLAFFFDPEIDFDSLVSE